MEQRDSFRDEKATVLSVGDLILDVEGVETYFDESREILKSGDVVIGQVEIPYTARPQWSAYDNHSAPATDPCRLEAMKDAWAPARGITPSIRAPAVSWTRSTSSMNSAL